jgi:hypothetical protein
MKSNSIFIVLLTLIVFACKKETKEIATDQASVSVDVTFPCVGDTWTQDIEHIFWDCATLVYNNKAWVFASNSPIYQGHIYIFDGTSWTSIQSDIPIYTRDNNRIISFVLGNKAYIGITDPYGQPNHFYEYSFATNTWTPKANYPWQFNRWNTATFAIGNKGYMVGGRGYNADGSIANYSDTWEYYPATNKWTQKANCSFFGRAWAEGFSIGNKGYIVNGSMEFHNGWVYENSMLEYNPATNSWSTKAYFPGAARDNCQSFVIDGMAYVGAGNDHEAPYFVDFYKYNPTNNSWLRVKDIPSYTLVLPPLRNSFSLNSRGYIIYTDGLLDNGDQIVKYTPKNCDFSSPLRSDNTPVD